MSGAAAAALLLRAGAVIVVATDDAFEQGRPDGVAGADDDGTPWFLHAVLLGVRRAPTRRQRDGTRIEFSLEVRATSD